MIKEIIQCQKSRHLSQHSVFQEFIDLFFWMAGFYGLFNFGEIVLEMVDVGLPWPVLFATGTILCQLVGSALVISNFAGYGWIGSAMLIVFTLLTIPVGHPFWKFSEPQRTQEFHIALEHITVIGGVS